MTVLLRCPGVDSYGHGHGETTVHADGCCARFALAGDEMRERTGLRIPVRSERDEPRPVPPDPEIIDVAQLCAVVEDLQYRATADPDAELGDTIVWVEIAPEDDLEEVLALIDLGRPYGLVAAWRRVLNSPEGTA